MKNDNKRLIIIALLTILLLTTIILYGYMVVNNKEIDAGSILAFIIPLIIIVFMAFFIIRRYKDIKKGMPFEDERSKRVMNRTAAMSFYISLYWLLAISFFEPLIKKILGADVLTVSETTGLGIAGMAIIFFINWFIFSRKDNI